jgi:hypothetical protein
VKEQRHGKIKIGSESKSAQFGLSFETLVGLIVLYKLLGNPEWLTGCITSLKILR